MYPFTVRLLSARHCWVKFCSQLARSVNHIEEGGSKPFSGNKIIHLLLWHLLKSHTPKLTLILQLLLKSLKVANSSKCKYSTNEPSESNSDFLLTLWLHQNQNPTVKADYASDEWKALGIDEMKHLPKRANTAYEMTSRSETCTCTASNGWVQGGRELHRDIPGEAGMRRWHPKGTQVKQRQHMKSFQSWVLFLLKIPYIPWLNPKGHRHSLQSSIVLIAQNGNCTHLGQLSAQRRDRPQLQSWGKIKVSRRQFTHFQRKTDNRDLEPSLKVVLL